MSKNVFITGGLTGIGFEVAKLYQARGYKVGICSFEAPQSISIETDFSYYQADVTDKDAVKKAITEFKKDFKTVDIVFANAGINHEKLSIPNWDRVRQVVDVNIIGVINTIEPTVDIMKEQGHGHIITIASVSAFCGLPGMAGYGASKSFILTMSETLALDLKKFGINITTVAPGFVKTPLTQMNSHKMPFLMEQSEAAKIIVEAADKKKVLKVFPSPMVAVSLILRHSPRFLYRRFMSSKILGFRTH